MFLDGKVVPKDKVRLCDVTLPNSAMHLIKLCVINNVGVWVYPFASHEQVAGCLESIITRKITMYQPNYCIRQNPELQHTTVAELADLYRNEGGRHFYQDI